MEVVAARQEDRGHLVTCRRCRGKGEFSYNHLNGDTYCYGCNGTGKQLVYTKAEKAEMEREAAWRAAAGAFVREAVLDWARIGRKGMEAEDLGEDFVYDRRTETDEQREADRNRAMHARKVARALTAFGRAASEGGYHTTEGMES